MPADQRPREKLLGRGPAALADGELLALLLRTGVQGQGVLALAQALLDRFGGIAGLLGAQAKDLKTIKGLGPDQVPGPRVTSGNQRKRTGSIRPSDTQKAEIKEMSRVRTGSVSTD